MRPTVASRDLSRTSATRIFSCYVNWRYTTLITVMLNLFQHLYIKQVLKYYFCVWGRVVFTSGLIFCNVVLSFS